MKACYKHAITFMLKRGLCHGINILAQTYSTVDTFSISMSQADMT